MLGDFIGSNIADAAGCSRVNINYPCTFVPWSPGIDLYRGRQGAKKRSSLNLVGWSLNRVLCKILDLVSPEGDGAFIDE